MNNSSKRMSCKEQETSCNKIKELHHIQSETNPIVFMTKKEHKQTTIDIRNVSIRHTIERNGSS